MPRRPDEPRHRGSCRDRARPPFSASRMRGRGRRALDLEEQARRRSTTTSPHRVRTSGSADDRHARASARWRDGWASCRSSPRGRRTCTCRRCTHLPPMRNAVLTTGARGVDVGNSIEMRAGLGHRRFLQGIDRELHAADVDRSLAVRGGGSARPQPVMPSCRASAAWTNDNFCPASSRWTVVSTRRAPGPSTSAHRAETLPGSDAATVSAVTPPRHPAGAPPRHAGPAHRHDSGGSAQSRETIGAADVRRMQMRAGDVFEVRSPDDADAEVGGTLAWHRAFRELEDGHVAAVVAVAARQVSGRRASHR